MNPLCISSRDPQLIDLAGSERLSSSGCVGERLTETTSINTSLSVLGRVFMALANKVRFQCVHTTPALIAVRLVFLYGKDTLGSTH